MPASIQVFDNWESRLNQTGPPPYSLDDSKLSTKRRQFVCGTVAELRSISYHPDNLMILLLGETQPFDGNLQGWFLAYDQSKYAEDGGSQLRSNDGRTVWKKIS